MIAHWFTVDVEEHFQVAALARSVPRDSWDRHESRVRRNTEQILELLERRSATATFFILGWVAARQPDLVRAIAGAGHELASHGWGHRKVTEVTPAEFRSSIARSRKLIEDLGGVPVLGYRAPSFSIVRGREWALDILVEEGYRYDSSLFPIRRRGYGYQGGARDLHCLRRPAGALWECPPATLEIAGARLPAAGGGYLRLLPFGLITSALRQAERRGQPATVYIHPWELDPEQPRISAGPITRLRHYGGLRRVQPRLERLLGEFHFESIAAGLVARGVLAASGERGTSMPGPGDGRS